MAFNREIASITIFCEASGEAQETREAVAQTLFNRLKDGRFGKTIAEICLRRMQFSEWNGDKIDNANLMRAARAGDMDAVMLECGAAYDSASGGAFDATDGATHYYDISIAPPAWTSGATRTAQLGRLVFYINVK